MKRIFVTTLVIGVVVWRSISFAQTTGTRASPSSTPGTQTPPAIPQQATAASKPGTPSPSSVAPPVEISSLTAKEILSANNQVVAQVASMYQHLGLFITIIVTLVGGVATWVSIAAKKSVSEFIQDWTRKMKSIESAMNESRAKLQNAVDAAEDSAKRAKAAEQSISDNEEVLNRTLGDVDRLRAAVASLSADISGQNPPPPGEPPPEPVAEAETARLKMDAVTDADATEVAARLQGKLVAAQGEGTGT